MREDWSDVSEEKLAELFPIILEPHNPEWKEYYQREKKYLQSVFGNGVVRISHIGSSSITGLLAKPTVDILLEVAEDVDIQATTEILKDEGYVVNHANDDVITFIKGYTPRGFEGQAVHVHVRGSGDWGELYFRDYLASHADVAQEYEALKMELRNRYLHDRDGYTDAKGQFVKKYTDKARQEFPDRYAPQQGRSKDAVRVAVKEI